jgi:hypothetical protein
MSTRGRVGLARTQQVQSMAEQLSSKTHFTADEVRAKSTPKPHRNLHLHLKLNYCAKKKYFVKDIGLNVQEIPVQVDLAENLHTYVF